MPGIVFCKRRCRFGSDDLLLPGLLLLVIHIAWVFIFGTISSVLTFHAESCWLVTLQEYVIGLVSIYGCCVIIEGAVTIVSTRGSVINSKPRAGMTFLLYVRLAVLLAEIGWQVFGVMWIIVNSTKSNLLVQGFIIGSVLSDWLVIMVVISTVSLSDVNPGEADAMHAMPIVVPANSDAVACNQEMSKYQFCGNSRSEPAVGKSFIKSFRHDAVHHSVCCFKNHTKSNSFAEIAGVLSVFLRNLDLVPTDIIVGLILMHRRQKLHQRLIISEYSTEVYQFLSGAAITSSTRFLSLKTPETLQTYERVVHYMRYPVVAYECQRHPATRKGQKTTEWVSSRCFSSACDHDSYRPRSVLVEDSGCHCLNGDLNHLHALTQFDLLYISYHSDCDVDAIPFFVGLDHAQKSIVICIWNRLCLLDVFSNFSPEVDTVSATEPMQPWIVNKGFLTLATFVYNKIKKDKLLIQALNFDLELGTSNYDLVVVGHSLAAGVAAILSVILRSEFPNVCCYAYSPPSGIVKETCVPDTRSFVISVVVGKDLVPRIGVLQTDAFRQHLLEALKACNKSKWRIICGATCCRCLATPLDPKDFGLAMQTIEGLFQRQTAFGHQQMALSIPGRIIHVIRSHPKPVSYGVCATEEPVFQAIWAEHHDFNEILVSPTMISDHSPYVVYDALQKVLTRVSPTKPSRKPMKQQSCSMTPNSSSNVCDTPHPEFHQPESYLEPEVTGRVVTTLTLSQPIGWKKMTSPTHVADFSSVGMKDWPKNFSLSTRQHLIEVRREDLLGSAPLASPEVLSETSSLASFGSGSGSVRQAGYQRLTSGTGKMDPIKQSPLSHSLHVRGYSLILEPTQSEEEATPANHVVLHPSSDAHRTLVRSSNELYRKTIDGEARNRRAVVEICAAPSVRSSVGGNLVVDGMDGNFSCTTNHTKTAQVVEIEIHEQKVSDLDEFLKSDLEPTDMNATTLTLGGPEFLKDGAPTDCRSLLCEVHVPIDSDRESVESGFERQCLYDGYAGHYSPAGRGYPHGFTEFYSGYGTSLPCPDIGSGVQLANGCRMSGDTSCFSYMASLGNEKNVAVKDLD